MARHGWWLAFAFAACSADGTPAQEVTRAPDRAQDLVSRVERITRTRVDHSYEIHRAGELTCQACSTLACVGREGRPRLMPETLWAR